MTYARVVGAIALLGLLAACDDSRAPDGGATPVMDVGHTPIVVKQGEVLRDANGNIIARSLSTAEMLDHLEKRALEHPEFLDEMQWGGGENGVRVPTGTGRYELEELRRQYAIELAMREWRAVGGDSSRSSRRTTPGGWLPRRLRPSPEAARRTGVRSFRTTISPLPTPSRRWSGARRSNRDSSTNRITCMTVPPPDSRSGNSWQS